MQGPDDIYKRECNKAIHKKINALRKQLTEANNRKDYYKEEYERVEKDYWELRKTVADNEHDANRYRQIRNLLTD